MCTFLASAQHCAAYIVCDPTTGAADAPRAPPHRSRADALAAQPQPQPPPGGKGGAAAAPAGPTAGAGEQQLSVVVSEAPAGGSEEPPPFEDYKPVLFEGVVRPLTAVQSSLISDTVAWQRGVLATPAVVRGPRQGWVREPGCSAAPLPQPARSAAHPGKPARKPSRRNPHPPPSLCTACRRRAPSEPPSCALRGRRPLTRPPRPRPAPGARPAPQVPQMLRAMIGLVVPLEAMHAALRPPDITKRFDGTALRAYVLDHEAAHT